MRQQHIPLAHPQPPKIRHDSTMSYRGAQRLLGSLNQRLLPFHFIIVFND